MASWGSGTEAVAGRGGGGGAERWQPTGAGKVVPQARELLGSKHTLPVCCHLKSGLGLLDKGEGAREL